MPVFRFTQFGAVSLTLCCLAGCGSAEPITDAAPLASPVGRAVSAQRTSPGNAPRPVLPLVVSSAPAVGSSLVPLTAPAAPGTTAGLGRAATAPKRAVAPGPAPITPGSDPVASPETGGPLSGLGLPVGPEDPAASPSGSPSSAPPAVVLPEAPAPVLPPAELQLAVPFGLYVASRIDGEALTYIGAMELRNDGTYSMSAGSGTDIPDPAAGRDGRYLVLSDSTLTFLTGPYAGGEAKMVPDFEASGRDYVDVTYDGVFTSYRFEHP